MTETVGVTFDVDALRRKYAEERARRLRPDGIAQYVEMTGAFARFADDPWADGRFAREPLTDEVDVADHRRRLRRAVDRGAAASSSASKACG